MPINFLTTVGPNAEVIVVGPDGNKNKVKNSEDKSSWPAEIRIKKTHEFYPVESRNKSNFYPGKFSRECIALKEILASFLMR